MPRWRIELVGAKNDLKDLQHWFPAGDVTCMELDGNHYLTGSAFESFDEAQSKDAMALADNRLRLISGTISLLNPHHKPLRLGAPYLERDDGVTIVFASAHIVATSRVEAKISSTKDGEDQPPPLTTVAQDVLRAAMASKNLRDALEVWGILDRTWPRLFRVIEEIECELGKGAKSLPGVGLCSKAELDRFKHSANSKQVAGIDARHGKDYSPPSVAMTRDEAEQFVGSILAAVLRANVCH